MKCEKCGKETTTIYMKDYKEHLGCPNCINPYNIMNSINAPTHLQGWICPNCGSCYSPFINECPKCINSNFKLTLTNTTGC
jgi:hypothetical protein